MGREGQSTARVRVNKHTLNRNIGKYNLHCIWDRVLLNTPGPKIKGHAKAIGHAQPNSHTPLNQPKSPTPLNQPNTPMQFFTDSMKHAQRTSLSKHMIEPPRTYIRNSISVFLQT